MAIEPNILLRASEQFKPISMPDPMENYAKLMRIKAMQSEMEGQALDMAAKRQAAQDDATYRQMAMQGAVTPEMLESKGLYKQGGALRKSQADLAKEKVDLQAKLKSMKKSDLDIAENQAKAIQEVSMALDALPDDNSRLQAWQTVGAPRLQQAGLQGIDPNVLPDPNTRKMHTAQATALTDALAKLKEEREKGNVVATEVGSDSRVWGRDRKGGLSPILMPNGQQLTARQPAQIQLQGMVSGAAGPGAAQLYAERLIKGLEDWPSSVTLRSDPVIREGVQLARQIDPSFNAATHAMRKKTQNAFTSGKEASEVKTLNTAIGHVSRLSDLAEQLDNGKYRAMNQIKNKIKMETGDPVISEFDTVRKAVADEVTKLWRSTGGSEKDVQAALSNLDPNLSPKQLRANIYALTDLMGSRQEALENQYKKGLGKFGDVDVLDDKSRDALTKVTSRYKGAKVTAKQPGKTSTEDLLKLFGK